MQLRVTLDEPSTDLGIEIEVFENDGGTRIVASQVFDGPLYQSGLMENDVFLTVDHLNIHTPEDLYSAIQNKTDMEFVVKRMARSRGQGRRENKIYTFHINISRELGLGLNLKMITSDFENEKANTFLYVSELREYPNGEPGPGLVAGVRPYDLLLKMNGVEIHTIADVKGAIQGKETVQCEVRRMIRHLNEERARKMTSPKHKRLYEEITVLMTRTGGESLGLSLSEAYCGGSDNPFVIVTNVRSGSVAERVGIKVRDIIWQVQQKPVLHIHDLKGIITGLDKFEITVRRET